MAEDRPQHANHVSCYYLWLYHRTTSEHFFNLAWYWLVESCVMVGEKREIVRIDFGGP